MLLTTDSCICKNVNIPKNSQQKKWVANTFKRAGAMELATPEIMAATIYV
jgi:hypothetical protein